MEIPNFFQCIYLGSEKSPLGRNSWDFYELGNVLFYGG